ncbi:MAG TPA: DNA-binding protein Alba [Candidatus Aenigmarchaeota archaeon]|nr:DNA-binding protein Alba [Candidatus Aenigmarchaeota archaeon]
MGNVVLVGKKPTINYVLSALTILENNGEVVLKARGRAISKAVDVSQIVINKFMKDAKIEKVSIGTDTKETEQGTKNFSVIEIVMKK